MTRKPSTVYLALSLLALIPLTLPAAPLDVVLTLDRSLSMHQNDPARASIQGAKLFTSLLGPNARLGLMTFGQDAQRLLPLTPLKDKADLHRAASLIERIRMDGIQTNFAAALKGAYQDLTAPSMSPASKRILILFSDGQLNLGNDEATNAARTAIVKELVPQFQAAGIRIYGVAFSPDADLPFLRALSEATGGVTFRANTPEDIYNAFVKLFEQTDQPLIAPLVDGKVNVDANVGALKLLVRRTPGSAPVELTDPSHRRLTPNIHQAGVDWQSTPSYDHITIQHPEPGPWQVAGGDADQKAYIESDLGLETSLPVLAKTDELVKITARLTYQGSPIDLDVLKDTTFNATIAPESTAVVKRVKLWPASSGQGSQDYQGHFSLSSPGTFRVIVTARGGGFERSKASFISIVTSKRPLEAAIPQSGSSDRAPTDTETLASSTTDTDMQHQAIRIVLAANGVLIALLGIGIGVWRWRHRHRDDESDTDD